MNPHEAVDLAWELVKESQLSPEARDALRNLLNADRSFGDKFRKAELKEKGKSLAVATAAGAAGAPAFSKLMGWKFDPRRVLAGAGAGLTSALIHQLLTGRESKRVQTQ